MKKGMIAGIAAVVIVIAVVFAAAALRRSNETAADSDDDFAHDSSTNVESADDAEESTTIPEDGTTEKNYDAKIYPGTYELSERDGDRYLVYLWLKGIDMEAADKALTDKGVDVDAYKSSMVYNDAREQETEWLTVETYGEEGALSAGETATVLEDMIRDNYKEYISMRRSVIRELYEAEIDRFVSENAVKEENIKYRGYYTGTLVLSATEDEIKRYSRDDSVTEISPYVEGEVKSDLTFTDGQINTE